MAALEVGRARQDQASAAADVDRLSREALELTSQLAEAAATHRVLEGRLAEARTAVDAANARTEHERLAARPVRGTAARVSGADRTGGR